MDGHPNGPARCTSGSEHASPPTSAGDSRRTTSSSSDSTRVSTTPIEFERRASPHAQSSWTAALHDRVGYIRRRRWEALTIRARRWRAPTKSRASCSPHCQADGKIRMGGSNPPAAQRSSLHSSTSVSRMALRTLHLKVGPDGRCQTARLVIHRGRDGIYGFAYEL